MQEKYQLLPMVQDFIHKNMPSGGYKMVSKRLLAKGVKIDNQSVLREIKTLKRDTSIPIVVECCIFMKENLIPLNKYCEDFIKESIVNMPE
jgi:adenylosuccinate synthase